MELTTPFDMRSTKDQVQSALSKFEVRLKTAEKGKTYYHIVIGGELSRDISDEVEKAYKEAGWKEAICKTSSENGERPGLTSLKLTK